MAATEAGSMSSKTPVPETLERAKVFRAGEAAWDEFHNTAPGAQGPAHAIFTDEDPATTVKGCGFKDAETARRTLFLTAQPGARWKRYWTVRAMLERCERHALFREERGEAMRAAAAVFRKWIEERQAGIPDVLLQSTDETRHSGEDTVERANQAVSEEAERAQQDHLRRSAKANATALRYCGGDLKEHERRKREARNGGLKALRQASTAPIPLRRFPMKACEFVALFGAPGTHAYGHHICATAKEDRMHLFQCSCPEEAFSQRHQVEVVLTEASTVLGIDQPFRRHTGTDCLGLGKQFPFETFVLGWDGKKEEAWLVHWQPVVGQSGRQRSMLDFVQKRQDRSDIEVMSKRSKFSQT